MPSKIETILEALTAAIAAGTAATVERGSALPMAIPAEGLVLVDAGDPGEPEVTLSPLTYLYEHVASVQVFVADGEGRNEAWDALKLQIGIVIAADRSLDGLCDWIEAAAPETDDLAIDGAAEMKSGIIPVRLFYTTTDPLT